MPASLSSFDKCVTEKLSDVFKTAYKLVAEPAQGLTLHFAVGLLHYSTANMDRGACVAGHAHALPVNSSVPSVSYLLENCTPEDYRESRPVHPS